MTCVRGRMPIVALVGRANVGKSTLFNRLVGGRPALVFDTPGVTRDRIFGVADLDGRPVRLVDTGGLTLAVDDALGSLVYQQTRLAIEEAEVVCMVVDAAAGLHPVDRDVAALLRRCHRRWVLVANKVDVPTHMGFVDEFYRLGATETIPVSAEHNRGVDALIDTLRRHVRDVAGDDVDVDVGHGDVRAGTCAKPDATAERNVHHPKEGEAGTGADEPAEPPFVQGPSRVEWRGGPIRLALVGRPNAGKSSLANALLGEERHLAHATPGTTRDAIDSPVRIDGQDYVLTDTAGVRRKRAIADKLEQFAVVAAFDSIDRSDVAVVLLDGAVPPTDQDARLAAMAHDKGRGLVLAINKWDLVTNPDWRERYVRALRLQMPFADYVPIVKLSAKTGRNLGGLLAEVKRVQAERHRRITTGELNRFFRDVVQAHPPPIRGGYRPQLYFVSQPMVRPPTFVFASNRAETLHFSYRRYLANALRQRYGFAGTPLWLKFRAAHAASRSART